MPNALSNASDPLIPVVLSGGSGTRLWPVSRRDYPKQFLPLMDAEHSLLQQTLQRLEGMAEVGAPILVCNEVHRFLVAEQLRQIDMAHGGILLEPAGRNTAPAIALAAFQALNTHEDALLLVMPADHVIGDVQVFHQALERGRAMAEQGRLVTFGITPTSPHTGYGYIRAGTPMGEGFTVDAFVEKPNSTTAQTYLSKGKYYWNSGMFMFRAQTYLAALEQHAPEILEAVTRAWQTCTRDLDFTRVDHSAFEQSPDISIDYAVMEHTDQAVVLPLASPWSDIGAWDAVFEARGDERDAQGNVSTGDVLLHDTTDSLVMSQSRLVATLGLANIVAIETEDAILLADRSRMQDLRHVVARLERDGRTESRAHCRVHRPWGWYRTMVRELGFQVKEIMVTPGAALSLQMHHHRAEHWVVVQGTAKVTRADRDDPAMTSLRSMLVTEDESIYLPLGTVHRLENPGKVPLKLIEVQTGRYLDEDDIVRFEDVYNRVE
ncbi:mannose-1-phosphate guanylyltransferase/mannose-6-phosphate isomerase [Kushneria marisflavi]|uniref:mannose-1-phosphate guanylyltransferase n=1 Tax=Kushneria marisflavi TaxID=157779 RepID=A0A240UR13_9GAMM|nr:mannose-1-phosphate guanylyltransferase/mannose-6-phosphate isomerase [Kushneria marisflavi]ART63947.1 mannose-1-phosphate guanylyltransferase/mannose-6-phosphate isomerase [Kushneria marisflavi]RKD85669.1 mannose-1-phosphate guanylyltransferase/mannose-1-phosphate guanylyltransferase/mannose-6-phosphate isomerase [Kushneria marisflavi]